MKQTVGLIICDCKGAITEFLDIEAVVPRLSEEACVYVCDDLCSALCVKKAGLEFKKMGLNALVIGACSSPAARNIVVNALAWAGWPASSITFSDIRERCAFSHKNRLEATEKCITTLKAAIARASVGARWRAGIKETLFEETKRAKDDWEDSVVIIGGGIGGMACALAVDKLNHHVTLVEKEPVLGGKANASPLLEDDLLNPAAVADDLRREVSRRASIDVMLSTQAIAMAGMPGRFRIKVRDSAGEREVRAGAAVLATGSHVRYAKEMYGFDQTGFDVLSLSAFEKLLKLDARRKVDRFRGKRVGFVVDVSTQESKNFITRALKYARHLNENYGTETYVFCNDIKVAGYGLEMAYRNSRASGTVVVKYEGQPPRIDLDRRANQDEGTGIMVTAFVPSLGEEYSRGGLRIPLDILVLDEKLESAGSFLEFADSFGAGGLNHNFFQAANIRLQPSDTCRPGLWVVGGCRGDLDVEETLADARTAANRIDMWLSGKPTSRYILIDAEKCARCLACVRLCPAKALSIEPYAGGEKSAASVDESSCQGCGLCAAACPARAISYLGYLDEQVFEEVRLLGGRG